MRKEDVEWEFTDPEDPEDAGMRNVEICGKSYFVGEETACLVHAILLLMDSFNDKDFTCK